MTKKLFTLSLLLILIPIGLRTYQAFLQEVDGQTYATETNLETTDVSVEEEHGKESDNASATRTITVHNKIDKKMITYHKGFFSLTPNFKLTVNNKIVQQGQQLNVPVIDDTINITYEYDFMGHKKGKKNITFEVPNDKNALDVTFSWKDEPRVRLGNAKALAVKQIY